MYIYIYIYIHTYTYTDKELRISALVEIDPNIHHQYFLKADGDNNIIWSATEASLDESTIWTMHEWDDKMMDYFTKNNGTSAAYYDIEKASFNLDQKADLVDENQLIIFQNKVSGNYLSILMNEGFDHDLMQDNFIPRQFTYIQEASITPLTLWRMEHQGAEDARFKLKSNSYDHYLTEHSGM